MERYSGRVMNIEIGNAITFDSGSTEMDLVSCKECECYDWKFTSLTPCKYIVMEDSTSVTNEARLRTMAPKVSIVSDILESAWWMPNKREASVNV